MSNSGNTFNSGPINLEEDNKITFDDDGDQWNWIQATSGEYGNGSWWSTGEINKCRRKSLYGDITVQQVCTICY